MDSQRIQAADDSPMTLNSEKRNGGLDSLGAFRKCFEPAVIKVEGDPSDGIALEIKLEPAKESIIEVFHALLVESAKGEPSED